jgi:hypothetical protein
MGATICRAVGSLKKRAALTPARRRPQIAVAARRHYGDDHDRAKPVASPYGSDVDPLGYGECIIDLSVKVVHLALDVLCDNYSRIRRLQGGDA